MPKPIRYRRRRPGEAPQFTVPLNQRKGPIPGPEILPWYWNPKREGAQPPPAAFKEKLESIDPDLAVCFSPVHERWLIWVRNPRIRHWMCRGWQLLFLWEHPITHEFLPLNELVFHNLMLINAERFRNASEYYDRIQADVEKAKAERQAKFDADRTTEQEEWRKQVDNPSTAGTGSKCALNDSLIPSAGEAAWRAETRKHRLPSHVLKQEKDEREKAHYGR